MEILGLTSAISYRRLSAARQMTPAPIVGGTVAPTAPACNLTLASNDMQDMSGCYARGTSSNARGRWIKLDETAIIEWQVWLVSLPSSRSRE